MPMPTSPRFATPSIEIEHRPDGTILLRSRQVLESHPAHLGLLLRDWAERAPERVFLAERRGEGARTVSYGEARRTARALASRMLLDRSGEASDGGKNHPPWSFFAPEADR